MRSFRATDRLPRGEGEELVRRVLEDLVLAQERDPRGLAGVPRNELARCLGVTRQRVDAILAADRPDVNLRAGQIPSLPPRARRAVLAALNACSRDLDGPEDYPGVHRRLGTLYGKLSAVLDRALEDKVIDESESEELRSILGAIAGEAGAVAFGGAS
mgnify:CR=1 FL=1